MGYVFDFKDSLAYEKWFYSSDNQLSTEQEARLILGMLKPTPGRRLLDIGCGTGARLSALLEKGLDVTGLDPSPYMLDIAKDKLKNRVDFHRGVGESLPFDDNAFDYVTLITSLEYVQDPQKVLEEAGRVAKDKIFIGIYNRHAVKCIKRRVKRMFAETMFDHAQFYSIWKLKSMVRAIMGDVPMNWKTICRFPATIETCFNGIGASYLLEKMPFGEFAGMLIKPVPRFKATPLKLKYKTKHSTAPSIQPLK